MPSALNSDGRLVGPPVGRNTASLPTRRSAGASHTRWFPRVPGVGLGVSRIAESVAVGTTWNSGSSARAGGGGGKREQGHGHACAETALKGHRPTLAAARRLSRRGNP